MFRSRALELSLFRTFGGPSISAPLHRTGEFERRAEKRYALPQGYEIKALGP
jgi:hypothetical protein